MRPSLLLIIGLAMLLAGPLSWTGVAADTISPLTLTCPDNITVVNDTYQCGAVVSFAPVVTGAVPIYFVTCSPNSGATFPLGTTTVNCVVTDGERRTATCSFTVTVRNSVSPPCDFCFFSTITHDCTNSLVLVASSTAGAPFPFGSVAFSPGSTAPCVQGNVTRSDGLRLDALYPIGATTLTEAVTDTGGNSSQCTATVTVLPQFVRLASKVYVHYQVPTPGGPVELSGPAELLFEVNFPIHPTDPSRIHALINLHDVVATLGGVEYHATNNVDAQLTANQLSPIPLVVPGRYKFEAHGKAALHSFSLDMPLDAVITAGALSSASFRQPQLVQP